MVITTSRTVAAELDLRAISPILAEANVQVVLDTCTYYLPRPSGLDGLTTTISAKWAYHGQGILDIPIVFAAAQ